MDKAADSDGTKAWDKLKVNFAQMARAQYRAMNDQDLALQALALCEMLAECKSERERRNLSAWPVADRPQH